MTYTSHGHHIPGTPMDPRKPSMVARCGGPGLCTQCSAQGAQLTRPLSTDTEATPKFKTRQQPQIFRTRATNVEAMKITAHNAVDVAWWCGGAVVTEMDPEDSSVVKKGINVPGLDGNFRVSEGDYLVRASTGAFTRMTRHEFEATYSPTS